MAEIIIFPKPDSICVTLDHYPDFDDFLDGLRRAWVIMHPGEELPIELLHDDDGADR